MKIQDKTTAGGRRTSMSSLASLSALCSGFSVTTGERGGPPAMAFLVSACTARARAARCSAAAYVIIVLYGVN